MCKALQQLSEQPHWVCLRDGCGQASIPEGAQYRLCLFLPLLSE